MARSELPSPRQAVRAGRGVFVSTPLSHDVLIFGASCRAAAFSALRAGLRPRCADYFADRDLAAVCPVDRIDPRQAAPRVPGAGRIASRRHAGSTPAGSRIIPAWVEQIARRHRLWGASARTLRIVRDPIRVAALLQEQGIPFPAVRRDPQGLPRDGSWLVKPLAFRRRPRHPAADGRAIDQPSVPCYFQERIDGPSFSALYIGER